MEVVHRIQALREHLAHARSRGERIAFVPTMGNLHEGHLGLVDAARVLADTVVVSIFVNPLQFGPTEDLEAYPRTLDADRVALADRGVRILFAPSAEEMYPDAGALATRVTIDGLSSELCGADRPGHFDGVATVVTKLFNLVQPDVAVFGRKDLQQLTLIRRMVRDLSMPVEIVGIATARAPDGLALSSRNGYLDDDARARAPALHRELTRVARALAAGDRDLDRLQNDAESALRQAGLEPDYVSIRCTRDLSVPADDTTELVVLGAARVNGTRLIDNVDTQEIEDG